MYLSLINQRIELEIYVRDLGTNIVLKLIYIETHLFHGNKLKILPIGLKVGHNRFLSITHLSLKSSNKKSNSSITVKIDAPINNPIFPPISPSNPENSYATFCSILSYSRVELSVVFFLNLFVL